MSGWLQNGDGKTAEGNGLGATAATVPYVIIGPVDPVALAQSPTDFIGGMAGETAPLPAYGSPHPTNPALRLRNWSVVSGNNNTFAVANYGTGTAIFEREWFSRSGGYQTEEFQFPYAYRYRHTIPGVSNSSVSYLPVDQDLWAIETVRVRKTVRRVEVNVNVGGLIGDAIKAMDNQNNVIHIINGRAYRFEAGAYYEIRPNAWVVNYAWIFESGIRWNSTLDSTANIAFPPRVGGLLTDPGEPGEPYIAPPFYSIDAIPNPDFPDSAPEFRLRLDHAVIPNGYTELVGLPPL